MSVAYLFVSQLFQYLFFYRIKYQKIIMIFIRSTLLYDDTETFFILIFDIIH